MPSIPSIERTCQTCGKTFTRPRDQNDPNPNHGLYCSRACSNLARRQVSERVCSVCGAAFTCKPAAKKQYCSNTCAGIARSGEHAYNWNGGKMVNVVSGYIYVLVGTHKYVLEHRFVMEQHLGRPLTDDEEVHHRNHDRTDNRIENLQLLSHEEHEEVHELGEHWSYKFEKCIRCGRNDRPHAGHGLCTTCYQAAWVRREVGHYGPNRKSGRIRGVHQEPTYLRIR
jgi:hypothetical protein